MSSFTAKDVQQLRQSTGAGMMDAKKALEACDGDSAEAAKWLRERGLAGASKRSDRENSQGAVSICKVENSASIVELKCETDFVAKSDGFVNLCGELAEAVARSGESAIESMKDLVDDLKVSLKENIEVGKVVHFQTSAGNCLGEYLHVQNERGVNAVLVELQGDVPDKAHDVALHIAFARPEYLSRQDVPAEIVDEERKTLETLTRNEGKPEAAIGKIVEGRLNGFFKERCLLEQAFVKDEKETVGDSVKPASIVRFSQVIIGT